MLDRGSFLNQLDQVISSGMLKVELLTIVWKECHDEIGLGRETTPGDRMRKPSTTPALGPQ